MSYPWDIPPLPTVADEDIDKTYCGVGCVIDECLNKCHASSLQRPLRAIRKKEASGEAVRIVRTAQG